MKSDSQHGQDIWVLEQLNYKINGYFVDVGAGQPWELSNTWLLETQYAWSGICIEGKQKFFDLLIKERKCTCVNTYVNHNTNETYINFTKGKGYGDYLDGYGKIQSKGKQKIKPRLLPDILIEHNTPKIIDYLSIDIEGAELNVLKTIDYNKYTFRTITVENNSGKRTIDFLQTKGYKFVEKIGEDDYGFIYNEQI